MRIKQFELGGHTIKVKYQKTVRDPETGQEIFGSANPMENVILVATELNGRKLAEDVQTHSLCHELAHFIMVLMNEPELNGNEQFIDILGGYIFQFLKSKK
jgi:hypothetical protein